MAIERGIHNVRVMLACEDYPSLKDRQVTKIDKEFPIWLGELSGNQIEGLSYRIKAQYGGGIIALRNLDDPKKYNSSEFALIAVDELTQNPFSTFEQLRSCLRYPGIDDVKFIAGTNPGGIGHVWVKRYFIDKCFPAEEKEPGQFAFVRSLPTDNPYNSPQYIEQLNSITDPKLRKAYIYGDWDIFEGQAFSEWNRNVHVCKPFFLPYDWARSLTIDYGWTAPSAVYWRASNGDGQRFYYKELYKTNLTPTQLGEAIADMMDIKEMEAFMSNGIFTGDPSMWATKAGEEPIANMILKALESKGLSFGRHQIIPAANDRVTKVAKFREGLSIYENYDKQPTAKIIFFENCKEAIRTIPEMQYSLKNPEDVDTTGEDHAFDSVAYDLMTDIKAKIDIKELIRINQGAKTLTAAGDNW
jgi:PBSX family phage terminase large subunit